MIRFPRPSDGQKKYLLEFLLENPEYVAHNGFSDYQVKMEKWQTVANKLNELEGTEKPGEQWYKYWCDLKRKVKLRAFAQNRPKSLALTSADKMVLELAGIPLPDLADLRNKFMPKKANLQRADMDYNQFGVEYKNIILSYIKQSLDIVSKPEQNVELVESMIKELNRLHKRNKKDYKKEWYWFYWMQKWIRIVRTNVNLNKLQELKGEDVELYKVMKFNTSNLTLSEDQQLHLLLNVKKHLKTKKLWENVSLEMEDLCGCKKGSLYWKIYIDDWSQRVRDCQVKSPELLTNIDQQLLLFIPEFSNTDIKSEEENSDDEINKILKYEINSKCDIIEEQPEFAFYDVNEADEDTRSNHLDKFSERCRVCLKDAVKMIDIFENQDNIDLPYKMNACASISPVAANDDRFPHQICRSCFSLIEAAFNYKKLAERSDAILRRQIFKNYTVTQRKQCPKHTKKSIEMLESHTDQPEREGNTDDTESKVGDTSWNMNIADDNLDSYDSDSLDEGLNRFWKEEVKPLLETLTSEKVEEAPKTQTKHKVEYVYNDVGEMTCSRCKYKTKSRRNYRAHISSHLVTQARICEICGKVCKNNSAVNKHKKTHEEVRQIKCEVCPYRTYAMSKLRVHLRKHTGEQPYQCPHCPKKASTSSNLRIHIKTHKVFDLSNQPVDETLVFLETV